MTELYEAYKNIEATLKLQRRRGAVAKDEADFLLRRMV